jgi:hypothetical protein
MFTWAKQQMSTVYAEDRSERKRFNSPFKMAKSKGCAGHQALGPPATFQI